MRNILVIGCLVYGWTRVLCGNPALAAEDWQTITTNAPNISFLVDKGSLERKGSLVYFRERMTFAKPEVKEEVSGRLIKEKRVQRVMNCVERTQGIVYGAIYAEGGAFITSTSFDDALKTMTAIPGGTVAEEELRLVCPPPSGKLYGVDFDR